MKFPESADPGQAKNGPPAQPAPSDEFRVAAVQEEVEISVDEVETGGVRVRKVIHQTEQPVEVTLREQRVEVRRISVNRAVDQREPPRHEGDTLIIPVFEYVPVVTMQLMLKEEVHVTTTESVKQVIRDVTLAGEEVVVERRDGADGDWKVERDNS